MGGGKMLNINKKDEAVVPEADFKLKNNNKKEDI